jgi:DNA repair/transcription protein MET18/MMS19
VASHIHTLVPVLVQLARASPDAGAGSRVPAFLRAAAVDCLRGFTALPYHRLHPVRPEVVKGLLPVLDDPKRAVRRLAAACRNEWMTLT